jgi:site-specific recombinase XerD
MSTNESSGFDLIKQFNDDLIEQFKKFKKYEEGLIDSTLEQYERDLKSFSKDIKGHLNRVTARDVKAFKRYMKNKKRYKNRTILRRLSTLREF